MKMLERERRIKEELEEEEKLAKEREQLALQHEMENRKQMEREVGVVVLLIGCLLNEIVDSQNSSQLFVGSKNLHMDKIP